MKIDILSQLNFKKLNMKSKAIVVSLIALFALVLALQTVSASDFVSLIEVEFDDETLSSYDPIGFEVSQTVPVEVTFIANREASNVRVEIELEGGGLRDVISKRTSRFHVEEGRRYTKKFTLEMPSHFEFDDELLDDLSLNVRISAEDETTVSWDYLLSITVQREEYSLTFLSVDVTDEAIPGSTVAIDAVVQNTGHEELDNVYIKASIPELGIERKVFAGDIDELDARDFDDGRDELNREDTVNKRLYLTIPRNAVPGVYEVVLEAYNYDTTVSRSGRVVVNSLETGVLPTVTARSIETGEETTFEVVIVNPNDRMVVYTVTPEESKGLIVEVVNPVVTVPADGSKTVKVKVKATESADEGTHLVTVNVNSETELVRQVSFTVNVEKASGRITSTGLGRSSAVVILTVVLVIIFIVLLIVLIVLLTRKPAEPEEFGETSYY
jgi:uncharacterized membrane protein